MQRNLHALSYNMLLTERENEKEIEMKRLNIIKDCTINISNFIIVIFAIYYLVCMNNIYELFVLRINIAFTVLSLCALSYQDIVYWNDMSFLRALT